MNKSSKHNLGFTLIELLVVISIVGVLSTVVTASLNSARVKARDSARIYQIREVRKALDLYYLTYGSYPANTATMVYSEEIPKNWAGMIKTLSDEALIRASFAKASTEEAHKFSFTTTAYAMVISPYYICSIQDPLYKTGFDYPYSFAYVASANRQNYKIRIYLENSSNSAFNSSMTGTFLDSATTGNTACDKTLNYYCVGN